MKRFVLKFVLLFVLIFIGDSLVGVCFKYLVAHARGGETGRVNYICRHTSEDILIFGSSRATHHYDPCLLEDSLHMSCYNCGKDGTGIILSYGWFQMIKQRYLPKVLIYDIMPDYDLLKGDNMAYLPGLRYYYDEPAIDSIFWNVDKNERYKMLSYAYRYNSQFLQITMDNMKPQSQNIKGYSPLQGELTPESQTPTSSEDHLPTNYEYDPLKLYYLERLINECQESHIQLVFMVSPLYKNRHAEVLDPVIELSRRHNIPFISFYTDEYFNNQANYFRDSAHLNQKGATAYTKEMITELRKMDLPLLTGHDY